MRLSSRSRAGSARAWNPLASSDAVCSSMVSTSTEQHSPNTGRDFLATSTILTDIDSYDNVSTFADMQEASMSRVQLALNVSDLDAAVDFYSKLFAAEPAKRRPGYANFAVADPPLKLILIEGHGQPASLNHLGVEVGSTDEVGAAQARLSDDGLATVTEDNVTCCYAVQDKVWVDDPDGAPWEIYTVLGDAEMPGAELRTAEPADETACCSVTPGADVSRCC